MRPSGIPSGIPSAMPRLEAAASAVLGYGIALAAQFAVFPPLGIEARMRGMLLAGLVRDAAPWLPLHRRRA